MTQHATVLRVTPIGDCAWGDVRTVFGERGDPARCWCQYFKAPGGTWRGTSAAECETALRDQAHEAPGPGLIAYLDEEPVGWVSVAPRTAYPRLRTTRVVRTGSPEPPDDPTVWAVTCFVVRVGFRRRGIGAAMLRHAVEHAAASGARVLEGYPIDTAVTTTSAANLYHGTLSWFLTQGFAVASRPQAGRAVVRRELAGIPPRARTR